MSKMRWLCVALAAFLVLGSVAVAGQDKEKAGEAKKAKHEGRKGGGGGMTPEKMLAQYTETLGLNADQKEKVGKILDAYANGMDDIRSKFKALYQGVDKNDKAAMEGLAEKKKALMQDMKDLREQKDADILVLLTADQKEKFEKMTAAHHGPRDKKGEGKGEKKGDRPHGKKGHTEKPDA